MVNCFYDAYTILNKVYSDKAYFKQALSSTLIEEKNRAMTVKICYGVLDKDIELSYYVSSLTKKSPKLVIRTILKISMYAIKYMKKHDYAVINSAVSLVKKLGKGGMAGFVNAFLRRFTGQELVLPKDETEYLSVKYSYPLFAVKKLIADYGKETAIKIISSENDKNTVVFYGIDGESYLSEKGVKYEKTPFDNVFLCSNFKRNADYDKGLYTFQALGSVAICDVIDGDETLLDCCAAPGGKSVNLSKKFKHVLSFDIHEHRVELIKEYAERMKVNNITAKLCDSKIYNQSLDSTFDVVLCDSPCSGLGVVSENPDIKLNRDEKNVKEILTEQISILSNVSKYVKVGGYLYYSTCSVLKEENEGTVLRFLENNKNYKLVEIDSKLNHIKGKAGLQFLPHISFGNGFYVAKIKREE